MTGLQGSFAKRKVTTISACVVRDMLGALLSVPLLLLFFFVVLDYGRVLGAGLGHDGAYSLFGVATALALFVGFAFLIVVKRKTPFNPYVFLGCSLTLAGLVYYAYISSIRVAWVSDFHTMWMAAQQMVAQDDYGVKTIYNERALPVLIPLILLFGPNAVIVSIANLVFLLVIQLLGYDLARRIAGHRVAQGFTVLWIGAMEPIMALPITSHDIWGLLFLALFLWGFRVVSERLLAGRGATLAGRIVLVGAVIAMAALLTLLDLQRELVPFIFLGCVFAGLLLAANGQPWKTHLRPVLLLALSVFALYGAFSTALKTSGYMLTSEQGERLAQIRTGAYGSSLSNGTYGQGQALWRAFFATVDEETRRDLTPAIPLSDLALQPVARIGNIVQRSRMQAALGSQAYFFYQAQAQTESARLIPLTRDYNIAYSLLIALLALWSIVKFVRYHRSFDGLLQLAILSTLVGVLILTGESQPRYIFPLWFIVPLLLADTFAKAKQAGDTRVSGFSIWGWDMTRGVALLSIAYLLIAGAAHLGYGESHGRVLSGWRQTLDRSVSAVPDHWYDANRDLAGAAIKRDGNDQRKAVFRDLATTLKFPVGIKRGGGVGIDKTICVNEQRRALDFYYEMPHRNPRAIGAFTLNVLVDDVAKWSTRLPYDGKIKAVKIPDILGPNACGNLRFELRTTRDMVSQSWIDASQTNLYFVRLVR